MITSTYSLGGCVSNFWKHIENIFCPTARYSFEVPVTIRCETELTVDSMEIIQYVRSKRISIVLPKGYKVIKEVSE